MKTEQFYPKYVNSAENIEFLCFFCKKIAPTKTFKTTSKSFRTTTNTFKRLQIPKSRSLAFLRIQKKIVKMRAFQHSLCKNSWFGTCMIFMLHLSSMCHTPVLAENLSGEPELRSIQYILMACPLKSKIGKPFTCRWPTKLCSNTCPCRSLPEPCQATTNPGHALLLKQVWMPCETKQRQTQLQMG